MRQRSLRLRQQFSRRIKVDLRAAQAICGGLEGVLVQHAAVEQPPVTVVLALHTVDGKPLALHVNLLQAHCCLASHHLGGIGGVVDGKHQFASLDGLALHHMHFLDGADHFAAQAHLVAVDDSPSGEHRGA